MTEPVPTTCMRCAVGCGHIHRGADVGYGLDTVRGDAAHPVNRGLACGRGIRETADPDGQWLSRPLVRKDGELVRATWADAIDRATTRLESALGADPDSVAVLGSGQQTIEAAYLLGKVARGAFGVRNYDANTTLCMASAVTAYYDAFGSDAPPPTYDDIPDAETHLVWGANPAVAHPVMFRWIADAAEEGELLVVDPVETQTADAADTHVAPDPGGDYALAQAVLARLVETDQIDTAFVEQYTTGFDERLDSLPSVDRAAADAGVSTEAVESIADALSHPTLLYWGMGVNQSVNGTATAGSLIDLCLATGNLGPGTGPFSLTGQANSMGTRVCSSKGTWPGHRPFSDPAARRTVADAWDVPVDRLPDDPGLGPVEMLDAGPDVIWTVGTNPAAGFPDATTVRNRLEDAFVIAQDAFRSETVEYADVVFPAATWGESAGTTMNMERTVSRVRPATDVPSGVKTDLELIATIGAAIDPDAIDPAPTPAEVFEEFTALTAGTNADCSGISYDRLNEEHAVRWPAPTPDSAGGYRYREPDGSWSFPTPSGCARFSTGGVRPLPEPPTDRFPLTVTTARTADGYNTGVRSGDPDGPISVRINPRTIDEHLAVPAPPAAIEADGGTVCADGDDPIEARVETPRDAIDAHIIADDAVPAGVVWVPIHHPEANRLTVPAVDPRSDEPNFKQCAGRVILLANDRDRAPTATTPNPTE